MKTAGIIAEYNPFHTGHKYQIDHVKGTLSADYVVIAMSGDFVQRGTPALLSKYVRAEMALRAGADLVLELPVSCATASAELFARSGVQLLDGLASWLEYDLCDSCPVYFGFVRTADLDSYQAWAITYKDYRPLFSVSDYGLRPWIKHCGYLPWCYYEFYVYPEYHLHFAGNYLPSNLPSHRRIFPASGRKSATFISAGNRKQLSQLYF